MTTPKEAIQEVLSKLDITDDKNWTEDGAPALDVVQNLANDPAITRAQINDANPGFVRAVSGEAPAVNAKSPSMKKPSARPAADITDTPLTDDQMRTILDRRVRDAEQSLLDAQKRVSEAQHEVVQCQQRLGRAHKDHSRQFPPITAAANIKAHLAAQGRQAELAAGVYSPLQAALTGRKRPVAGGVASSPSTTLLPRHSGAAA